MMTRGGRGVKNAENLMTSYVNDPLRGRSHMTSSPRGGRGFPNDDD